MTVTQSQIGLISSAPPSRVEKRAAFVTAMVLLVVFFSALPFAHVRLERLDVFLPIFATILFLTDLISATLLYAHFAILRSWSLRLLAGGYLFCALTIIPYALTFPGAFAPNGLLHAGLQTSPWLFTIWQMALPTTIIVYSTARNLAPQRMVRSSVATVVAVDACIVAALVCAVTWFLTAHEDMVPPLIVTVTDTAAFVKFVSAFMLMVSIAALVSIWLSQRSVLDMWLLIVALAWLLSSILLNLVDVRFDVAWYANRILAVASDSLVLLVLLAESTMLYARLAMSVLARQREREGQLISINAVSAAMAHEIRQPLTAIAANAGAGLNWIRRTPPNLERAQRAYEHIISDTGRVGEVIQSVREMFAGRERQRTLVDANDIIRETIALTRGELEDGNVVVELDLSEPIPTVPGHRGQIRQVLLNLVSNAIEAMRHVSGRRRVLRIRSEPDEHNGVALSVEDNGIGVAPENTGQIFDVFFTTRSDGMGIGLAVCRSIVEAHGGALYIARTGSHGSVFRVALPGSIDPDAEASPAPIRTQDMR
ncbi:MASE4 domain-containing protein [Mesorhizobium escarrei]|nr:MASE4 domain-containing protein [Mesorhizobium escarrei]